MSEMESSAIKTDMFSTAANRYMRTVAELWLGRWWWSLTIPVAACFALAATVNVAFTFVGFMVLFLIAPMIIMFLYFAHALTEEARIAVSPHCITADGNGLTVDFLADEDNGRTYPSIHVDKSEVAGIEHRSHDLMILLRGGRYRFLLIPYDAIGSDSDVASFSGTIRNMASESSVGRMNSILV